MINENVSSDLTSSFGVHFKTPQKEKYMNRKFLRRSNGNPDGTNDRLFFHCQEAARCLSKEIARDVTEIRLICLVPL
jgi:hypothetical protein